MARNKVQDALRQRKRSEAEAAMANGPSEEGAYQCFFNRGNPPSPMEGETLCDFPLAQLSGFPDHEEHFLLHTGAQSEGMVKSIRRHGAQSPILIRKTAEGTYIIISGHNWVNASKIAGLTTILAVIRADLTQETAEDLFYEMNFWQRSPADMLSSQRVLCIAAHYNTLRRQGCRMDLWTFETTSPDTQGKFHTDVKIAQEYELIRDKVSKYHRYATLYRPPLLLMNSGKRLGQLTAYEISFVEGYSPQECIYQFISEGGASISTAKGKKLRVAFEDGKPDASQAKSILSGDGLSTSKQPGRCVPVTLLPAFAPCFPPKAATKQIEETVQKALAPYFKIMGNASQSSRANRLDIPIDREYRVFLSTFYRRRLPTSKNLYPCVPDPFDNSTGTRLERMGTLRPDGEVNVEAMWAFAQIFGGSFFDDLRDLYSDQGEVSAVTAAFSKLAARKDCQNIYLLISLQYDTIRKLLPDPIWWLAGCTPASSLFCLGFVERLLELSENQASNGKKMTINETADRCIG